MYIGDPFNICINRGEDGQVLNVFTSTNRVFDESESVREVDVDENGFKCVYLIFNKKMISRMG